MKHEVLRAIILEQRKIIQKSAFLDRGIFFEEKGNYLFVGPCGAGKSTILYKRALDLVNKGARWEQIIFVNFDDDRLIEFTVSDFEDIVLVAEEMSGPDKPIYFLDEIQNIEGWEKFAMRLANAKEKVYITGSNAKMLSYEVEAKLGGRFLSRTVYPYSFREYLRANKAEKQELSSSSIAAGNRLLGEYFVYGGFPDTLNFLDKKGYVESIYQKILLGDIISRHKIRNVKAMRLLMKKIAETVGNEVSYTRLYNMMTGIGFPISKDSVIDYCLYAEEAFLLFRTENYYASFIDKESNPRFYFCDNGILNLFLIDKNAHLLENLVALTLKRRFGEELYYVKGKSGIDVDFFLPEEGLAIQASYRLSDSSEEREIGNLVKFMKSEDKVKHAMIVTYGEKKELEVDGFKIEVIPLKEFLAMME